MIYHRGENFPDSLARDIFGLIALFTSKNRLKFIKMFGARNFCLFMLILFFARCAIEFDLKGHLGSKAVECVLLLCCAKEAV